MKLIFSAFNSIKKDLVSICSIFRRNIPKAHRNRDIFTGILITSQRLVKFFFAKVSFNTEVKLLYRQQFYRFCRLRCRGRGRRSRWFYRRYNFRSFCCFCILRGVTCRFFI